MDNQEQKNSISDRVLEKIKTGNVRMKPRIYFALRLVLLSLGLFVSFFFIIYLVSFIVFSLRSNGVWFLPRFGFPAIGMLLSSLPWILIMTAVTLLILMEVFAEKLTLVYRQPIIYSLLTIILIVFVSGFLISRTPFHSNLFLKAQERHLPAIGPFYRNFGAPPVSNVHPGMVSEVTDNGFIIETPRGERLDIITSKDISLKTEIKEGDMIVVLGERKGDTVQASDIREVEKNPDLFPRHHFPEEMK